MYAYTNMTKVISISDDAYDGLKEVKSENESFSRVILRIIEKEKRKTVLDFFGKWPGPKNELDHLKKDLDNSRKNFKLSNLKFN